MADMSDVLLQQPLHEAVERDWNVGTLLRYFGHRVGEVLEQDRADGGARKRDPPRQAPEQQNTQRVEI